LSFEVGDYVFFKVSPMRGLHQFKVGGKIAPRFIRPFKILEQKGEVAYQLELPPQLSVVHDVFHMSQLKKCSRVPEEQVPLEDLVTSDDLTYQAVGNVQKSYPEHQDSDVQGPVEPPYRRRCRMGKRRRAKDIIPELLLWVVWISRARFLLRGVALSHPENSKLKRI
jgi:hypothetical protein